MASKSEKTQQGKRATKDSIADFESDSVETGPVDLDFMGGREDVAMTRSVASRERIRRQMEEDMQSFLSKGGAIQRIAPNVLADPPRKPSTAYGSRPI